MYINKINKDSAWIVYETFENNEHSFKAQCPHCGYTYEIACSMDLESYEYTTEPLKEGCPLCLKSMRKTKETPFIVGSGIGRNLLDELPPKTLSIDCDTIILNQRSLDISFKLERVNLEKFDNLTINGFTFVREKTDE